MQKKRVLADRVEHHRALEFAGDFAQNMNALRLKQAQMVQAPFRGNAHGQLWVDDFAFGYRHCYLTQRGC